MYKSAVIAICALVCTGCSLAERRQTPTVTRTASGPSTSTKIRYGTFTVTGYGKVFYTVGQADIQFSVSVRNDNVQQCKAQHDAIITKLNAYLMANEYPKGILSLEGTLLQRQRRQSSKLVEDFYLAKSTYSMRTDRIEDLSTLQADIVEIGVDEIEFVRLFSSEQRVLEDQARKLALDDAKAKAALTADELEWKLDKPIKVNYTNSPWSGQSRGFGSRGGHVQAAPIATSANFVDVVVQLTYSYRIDEKPAQ